MAQSSMTATEGARAAPLNSEDLLALKGALQGKTFVKGDAGYDEARTIWNAMIDRRPGLIVRCAGAADVVRAVNFARERRACSSRCAAAATTSPATRCATAAC